MDNLSGTTDREAIIDAINRFVEALDDNDGPVLESSITEDMNMDLTDLNKAGFDFKPFEGRQQVVSSLMSAVGTRLDTTHHVSNFRITVDGESATLTCYALAQHFRKGEGPLAALQDHYLMGNRYRAALIRTGDGWRICKLVVTVSWTQGDFGVMRTGE